MGTVSFHPSINAYQLAVWIFGAYFSAVVKPCLGPASHSSALENDRRVFAVVLAYDYVPCRMVGCDVHGNGVDVRERFGIAATPTTASWRLRGSGRATFSDLRAPTHSRRNVL